MQNPKYKEVLEAYNNLLTLSPKEKYKQIRTVAALAEDALINAQEIEELTLYAEIFKKAGNSRLLNKAKAKEFALKGITEVKTLKTKLGPVDIESGLIAVGDPVLGYNDDYDTKNVVEKMNLHNFFCVGTGGDGTFDITLRLVDTDEPLLGPKEYKFIINNSKTSVIKITSGTVKCADFCEISQNQVEGVSYNIENGYYKTAFYLKEIRDKYFGFVVVLSKTTDPITEEISEIETLG